MRYNAGLAGAFRAVTPGSLAPALVPGLLFPDIRISVPPAMVSKPVHVRDLQATILRCPGVDHLKLTCKFQGRHFRPTDAPGQVVPEILD